MDSGWRCVKGAGGYSYWHDARKWITSVYATRELAAAAADKLEAGALDVLRRIREAKAREEQPS